MVKQVEIMKKGFLNLLNPIKIPEGGFGDLGGHWRYKQNGSRLKGVV
jgi:hypothetical protein